MASLALSLNKRPSLLHNMELAEIIPVERIQALLHSNHLRTNWDAHDPHGNAFTAKNDYASEKTQLENYAKNYNHAWGGVKVTYFQSKSQWGRAYVKKALGLTNFRSVVRNTLIHDLYYDFDIKNCQPSILKCLCISNEIECSNLSRYCDARDEILSEVQTTYEVDRDVAKDLFLCLTYLGTYEGWCDRNKIDHQSKPPSTFIRGFKREIQSIAEHLAKQNPVLKESARKAHPEKKTLGSFFGLYCQEYENRIVEAVLGYLIHNTELLHVEGCDIPAGTYEFDGIKLLKENVDKFPNGVQGVCDLMISKTKELTGFTLEWLVKPFGEVYDLSEGMKAVEKENIVDDKLQQDIDIIRNALDGADLGIIETIERLYPGHFVYSVGKEDQSKGEWYGWNGTRWMKSILPLKNAISYLVPNYWRDLMKPWDAIFEKQSYQNIELAPINYKRWKSIKGSMERRIYELKGATDINHCCSVAPQRLYNDTLEFDAKEHLFGCANGVIDLEEECFRPYRFDDYVTMSCEYEFTPLLQDFKVIDKEGNESRVRTEDYTEEHQHACAHIMETYGKIFPDKELRDYFFKVISTGLTGKAIEKFFVFNGGGRNGKGLTNEFLEQVFGSYYGNVTSSIFTEKKKNAASANPELANLNKKRYVVTKEPSRSTPLQNSIIKEITGGGTLSGARNLYQSKSNVKLCCTLVMECNDKPPFDEPPTDADAERIVDLEFGSFFTAEEEKWDITTGETKHIYPIDTELKTLMKTSLSFKNAMLNLLLGNLLMVKGSNYQLDSFKPESVKKRSIAYLQNSYDIHNIFTSLFEKRNESNASRYTNWKGETKDEDWTLPKVAKRIRESNDFKTEVPKHKQKEYKQEVVESFFQKNSFYKGAVYQDSHRHISKLRGYRLKPQEEEETDNL